MMRRWMSGRLVGEEREGGCIDSFKRMATLVPQLHSVFTEAEADDGWEATFYLICFASKTKLIYTVTDLRVKTHHIYT